MPFYLYGNGKLRISAMVLTNACSHNVQRRKPTSTMSSRVRQILNCQQASASSSGIRPKTQQSGTSRSSCYSRMFVKRRCNRSRPMPKSAARTAQSSRTILSTDRMPLQNYHRGAAALLRYCQRVTRMATTTATITTRRVKPTAS